KLAHIAEVAEGRAVLGALGADRQMIADLRDHDADLAGRNLHPRVLVDPVDRPEPEPPTRHHEIRLITRLAREGDDVARVELRAEPLDRQTDFGRSDVGQRLVDREAEDGKDCQYDGSDNDFDHSDHLERSLLLSIVSRERHPMTTRPSPTSTNPMTSCE